MTRDTSRKYAAFITALLQVAIGVTGIVIHYMQLRAGQPVDAVHGLCFIGIALSGSNQLMTF